MPDTGAPWNIPYVAGTDLVADWPTDNQSQAEAVAAALTSANLIRQVVSTTKTDTFTTTSNSLTQVTGLTATITPIATSSKVLVIAKLSMGTNPGVTAGSAALRRAGTAIFIGDTASSRGRSSSTQTTAAANYQYDLTFVHLDSPSTTSATTYDVAVTNAEQSGQAVFVNRGQGDSDSAFIWRTASSITLLEVRA